MASDGQPDWQLYDIDSMPGEAKAAWNSMNADAANSNPALDYRFVDLLVRFFGDGSERFAICRLDDKYVAAAVVRPKAAMSWELFVPSQACLSPLLIAGEVNAPNALAGLMRTLPGICATLRCLRIDPACQPYFDLTRSKIADGVLYGTTFLINLEKDFDDYWQSRKKKLRYNMRKRFRSLESAGVTAHITIDTNVESMDEAVRVHGNLESKGWKGSTGTAISENNIQGRFYRELLREYARTNDALVARMSFDSQPVASLLCIGLGTTLIILKTAYDEGYAQYSPGRLIDYLVLQDICGAGKFKEMEMYTRASSTDLSWATDSREWYDIDICRNRFIYEGLKGAKWLKSMVRRPFATGTSNE